LNASVLKGLAPLGAAVVLFWLWFVIYRCRGTVRSSLQLIAIPCLVIVALAHVCEAFGIFPIMGWGHPHSLGHYIDLVAAAMGISLMCVSFLFRRTSAGT